ncbi:MAG: tetratricopeptide repeat protein [Planctomycetaceae bacterium]|nr:tetratricopeptide repeat protein [Planctomycetaceae bacterium]
MESQASKPRRRRLRQVAFKIAALLLSVAVAIVAGEVITRIAGSAPPVAGIDVSNADSPYRLCDNPILGYELVPNRPGVNSVGQRDVEHTIEKPAGVRRIVILGDSVVEGITLETKWENLIAWHLQKRYDKSKTEILNFGVRGYCTLAEVELLESKALQFKPDVVVLVFVDNDFRNFNADIALAARQRPAAVDWLFRNSDLFRILCLKTGIFHYGQDADPTQWNQTAIGDDNVQRGLERLKALAQKHNFQPLIAIWPTFLDDRVIDRACLPGTETPAVEVMAAQREIPTLRLSTFYNRGNKNPRKAFTNGDTLHPNETGCHLAADAIKFHIDRLASAAAQTQPASRYAASQMTGAAAVAKSGAMQGWDRVAAMTLAGEIWQNRGEAAAAMAQYEAALRLRPNDLLANLSLGRMLLQTRGNLKIARDCFERALRTDPTSADACNGLGVVLSRTGDASEAMEQFDRAVRLNPQLIEARNNLGTALLAAGRPGEAVDHLSAVFKASNDSAEIAANLGMALAGAGRCDEAIAPLRRALELQADYPQAHLALGNALAAGGNNPEAITHYHQALKAWPHVADIRVNLGAALMAVGRAADAIEQYRQALTIDGALPEAHNNLAVALASINKSSEAVEHYRQALRLRPDYVQASYGLGLALNKTGQFLQVIEPLQRACELSGWRVAECADALAIAHAGAGDFVAAAAMAEKAMTLAKDSGKDDLARQIARRLEAYRAGPPRVPNKP